MLHLLLLLVLFHIHSPLASSLAQESRPRSARQKPKHKDSQKPPKQRLESPVPLKVQLEYARNGHTVLRKLLSQQRVHKIRKILERFAAEKQLLAWRQKVEVASDSRELAQSCTTIRECQKQLQRLLGRETALPFLQFFNTHRDFGAVRQLIDDLAPVARDILGVEHVRIYQDALFWKRAGDGPTPWHSDARMAPFDTNHMLTLWIPLHDTSNGLVFASGSHIDFALQYWHDADGDLDERYEERHHLPLRAGDVTVHAGWTLHCADVASHDRWALAVTLVDATAPIRADIDAKGDSEDRWSYGDWVKEVPIKSRQWDHPKVPIIL